MLPKTLLASNARRMRILWITLLLLSPFAYLVGARQILKYDTPALLGLSIDRNKAIAIASDFAASKGVEVAGWKALCHFKFNKDLFFYHRLPSNADRERAHTLAPGTVIGVLFRSPDRSENFEVDLTADGRVLGYQRRSSQTGEEIDAGEPAARKLAQDALQQRLSASGLSFPIELKLGEARGDEKVDPEGRIGRLKGIVRNYTWSWPFQAIPELKLESVLTVRGNALFSDRVEAKIDKEFAKKNLNAGGWLKVTSSIIYGLAVFILVIYGVYRFVQRARQKEVSYLRVLILVALFVAVMVGFQVSSDTALYEVSAIPELSIPDWVILFQTTVSMVFIGLFMGLAYGSGEGDIREEHPGKLSSLDALLVGKLFSRNVARSTIWGWAIGGWTMLIGQVVIIPWNKMPATGRAPSEYLDSWLGYAPVLSPFLTWPVDTMLVLVIGLLLPLPFLHRRRRLGRAKYLLLFLCVWIACAGPYLDYHPWEVTLLGALFRAAFFLLALFYFDILTAVIVIASPPFISFAIELAAQPAPSLHTAGLVSLGIAFLVLVVEVYFAFRGRSYHEEEVSPFYAKNLAERLSMQAEVSAAREAQVRLMPVSLPKTDCFSIAASFKPAFEVGGDYYDVFELEPGKIGILLAEGGGRGLGSALSIAYAKGFLMAKIQSRYQTDDSPTEILRGLQDRLSSLLQDDSSLGLAYAVIDASDGRLRYARTGHHPVIQVGRQVGRQGHSQVRRTAEKEKGFDLSSPEEQQIRFSSHHNAGTELTIVEGTATLNAGDCVVLFTDGLDKDWQHNKSNPEREFGNVLTTAAGKSSDELQQTLSDSVSVCAKRARKQGMEDDLTAVIVRLDKNEFEEDPTPRAIGNTAAGKWRSAE